MDDITTVIFYVFTFDDITIFELFDYPDYASSCDDLVTFLKFLQLNKVKYNLFVLSDPMFRPEVFDFYMNDPYTLILHQDITFEENLES